MYLATFVFSIATLSPAPQDTNDLRLVDRVEAIVNDEILTWRQVMRTTNLSTPEGTTLTPRLFGKIGNDLIDNYLQVQGGIDMGFEEEEVKRQVSRNTERLIGSEGGMIQMAKKLDDKGISLLEREGDIRRQLYSSSWEQAVTGAKPGASGRTYQDRYVRPGQLRLRYKLFEVNAMEAELIRGTSARYHLQELILIIPTPDEAEPADEAESASVRAEKLRVRGEKWEARAQDIYLSAQEIHLSLLNGMDFTTAVQETPGTPENTRIEEKRAEEAAAQAGEGSLFPGADVPDEKPYDGIRTPLTKQQLAKLGGMEVVTFVLSATRGEISPPIEIISRNRLIGWRLIKLLDSDAPELPIFEVPGTQALLRKVIQDEGDDYRRSGGRRTLKQGAYIWKWPGQKADPGNPVVGTPPEPDIL